MAALTPGYTYGMGGVEKTERMLIETTHGLRVSPYFFAGQGVAWNHYISMEKAGAISMVTIFASLKGYLKAEGPKPFLSLDMGSGLPPETGKATAGCIFHRESEFQSLPALPLLLILCSPIISSK